MLLDVLTDNPGSVEVEKAYLATYRTGSKTSFREIRRSHSRPEIEPPYRSYAIPGDVASIKENCVVLLAPPPRRTSSNGWRPGHRHLSLAVGPLAPLPGTDCGKELIRSSLGIRPIGNDGIPAQHAHRRVPKARRDATLHLSIPSYSRWEKLVPRQGVSTALPSAA